MQVLDRLAGSLFTIADVAKELGVRACLCYEISDRDGMDKARESVMENAEFIRYALKDDTDMIAGMMGMHAQFTISDATMELALRTNRMKSAIYPCGRRHRRSA